MGVSTCSFSDNKDNDQWKYRISVIQILETFKCTLKTIMANNGVVQHANFGILYMTRFILYYIYYTILDGLDLYDSICRADKIYSGGVSVA